METFLIIVIIVSATLAIPQNLNNEKWNKFKLTHNKQYKSTNEELQRFAIFSENIEKIEEHNIKFRNGEVTYSKAINKFGDLTSEEFLAFLNRNKYKKPKIQQTKTLNVSSIQNFEAAVDWRSKGLVSEVKDEKECESSWSFSSVGAVEGQLALKTQQLIPLSEQNLIDCSANFGNSGCNGGFASGAYSYMAQNGIMSETDYPYEGQIGTCRFDSSKSVTSVMGYYDIDSNDEVSLQNTISVMGPVAASIQATEELQFYSGGILLDEKCDINVKDLNHGVLVVGYGTENGKDYWIVKNSWGSNWGENGYYRAIRNYNNNCGIATSATLPIL